MRLRIDADTKEWLEKQAVRNNRSVHAEIISYIMERKEREENHAEEEERLRKLATVEYATREAALSDVKAIQRSVQEKLRDAGKYPLMHSLGIDNEMMVLFEDMIEATVARRDKIHQDMLGLMEGKNVSEMEKDE